MPVSCAVINCSNRANRDKKSFFRFPAVINNSDDKTRDLSQKRRRLWLAAVNREDLAFKDTRYMRVCSDHFVGGSPSALYQDTHPGWIPSVKLGYDKGDKGDMGSRFFRLQGRKEATRLRDLRFDEEEQQSEAEPDAEHAEPVDQDITPEEELKSCKIKIDILKSENESLKHENLLLKKIVHKMKANNTEDFDGDDDKVRYYTGLPSFVSLLALFNLVSYGISQPSHSSLTIFQKLIITLMRLRLNLPTLDLSYRFGVSKATISRTFNQVMDVLYINLKRLVFWPDRENLWKTMPMIFRRYFGRRVSVIIDCFEVFIDRPSNLTARTQTWSTYKHHNTVKYLIGITPQGSVSYISEGWGGRVSDKYLTSNSDFTNHLLHGDIVLADRGFDIQEIIGSCGAELRIPAFTRGKPQLSGTEVEETRKIANVRIHVERVIGSVRQKYMILSSTVPIDYLMTKSTDAVPLLDKIAHVCCALTNMCLSVVPFQ
ncbi:uncharacterized protein LOC124115552 [Haliotis rufescens]|uniref:uncharacterized protein LOC124115552 n=1 Tax=Haliotis rufescens TaxID=6454 RepID=UPI00201EBD10|nr:uncharacterized protein LOC124115552 [Haliotis rufescens]